MPVLMVTAKRRWRRKEEEMNELIVGIILSEVCGLLFLLLIFMGVAIYKFANDC